jgi:glycosyltransferase involved in cell wall biosynthesis
VNANPEDLVEVLGYLLADGVQRREIGRRGRVYVEQHHNARIVAQQLAAIYSELLEGKRKETGK